MIKTSIFISIYLLTSSCSLLGPTQRSPASKISSSATCPDLLKQVLSKPAYTKKFLNFKELEPLTTYRIVIGKSHLMEEAIFIRDEIIDGIEYYKFSLLENPKDGTLVDYADLEQNTIALQKNQISGFIQTKKGITSLDEIELKLKNDAINDENTGRQYLNIIYHLVVDKFENIFKMGSIEVVSKNKFLNQYKKSVARIANEHIEYYKNLGFTGVKNVRFILDDPPGKSNSPFYLRVRLFNMHETKKKFSAIFLTPINKKVTRINDPHLVSHELGHNMIQEQFRRHSFINRSTPLQEAMVDIMAAHRLNDPKIFEQYSTKGESLRDLNLRLSDSGQKMHQILPESHSTEHDLSLHYSHLLWNIRKIISKNGFDEELVPIIKDLNEYYPYFIKFLYEKFQVKHNKINDQSKFYYEYQFFVAVLLKREWKNNQTESIKYFLDEFIKSNNLSRKAIDKISKNLERSIQDDSKALMKIEAISKKYNLKSIEIYNHLLNK